jgi:hypothetical protein
MLTQVSVATGMSWQDVMGLPDGVLETYIDVLTERAKSRR